jgi:hypothetical protein
MSDGEGVVATIREAFGRNDYPGDPFLQGSFDGSEPYEEVGAFRGRVDWAGIEPEFLDAHYVALSFFSEAGFRYFLPAYLIADVRGRLLTADPLFHLTQGFTDHAVEHPVGGRVFVRRSGRSRLINPRRYGAATWYDHARYRLSVFTREEAGAIVAYLDWKRSAEATGERDRQAIDGALASFWRERTRTAPSAAALAEHLVEERVYVDAISAARGSS